jgi:S-DNA-T family DNA segregation ATPase FtsK/SpoIIIE
VLLSELEATAHRGNGELPPVPYGLEDLPSEQARRTAVIDFASFGHLLAAGDRFSGRAQLLRMIAGSIAATISCADVHIYGIDCGNGKLLPVGELPHCGAVVSAAQADRAARLIGRLGRELDRRQELLAENRFRGILDQRLGSSPPRRLAHILVLLDRWEGFTEELGEIRFGALNDTIMRILRHGPRLGVHLVITGDQSVLYGRVAAAVEDKLAFRLADRDDYALAGLRKRDLPYDIPAGRAFRAGSGIEVQVALLDGEPTGAGQAAALRALAETARRRDADVALSQRPFRVEAADEFSDRFHVGDAQGRPVGREDVLAWLRARHAAGGCVALLGPRRAGKTWVLRELERRLADDGRRQVHNVTIQLPSSRVETPDELARVLDRGLRDSRSPAEELLAQARRQAGTADRLAYLLDEVGRLAAYGPSAVSWLRDLGQEGAWLAYTGTEKDWRDVVRWALKAPGSSFGNDVDARPLGPLDERDAIMFLTGTAANLRVNLSEETAVMIVAMVGSWPFYLQVVGDAVVRAAAADDLKPPRDAQALRDLVDSRLLDGWMTHFQGRWAEIGQAGRSALLRDPGHQPGDLAPGQRDDLRDVGLLLPGGGWLADRPFFDWLARNATELRDGERRDGERRS